MLSRVLRRSCLFAVSGLILACGPGRLSGVGSESGLATETSDTEGDEEGDPTTMDPSATFTTTTATGDGDGDPDTDSGDGDGDGDGDPATGTTEPGDGDGDGDGTTTGPGDGDGDGDGTTTGDGDGDESTTGDGDGDESTGDGDGDTTGDGDGDPPDPNPDGLPDGASCTSDQECASLNCYLVPFLGGTCGDCNEDSDCPDGGCSPPNPFTQEGSVCNLGEAGGGCESDQVCQPGLTCENVFSLLGLVNIDTCSTCESDLDCEGGDICTALVDVGGFSGIKDCVAPGSLPQDSYCDLDSNGAQACASGICSIVDIMGLAEVGSCGECEGNIDCPVNQSCVEGELDLNLGELSGSQCQ